MDSMEIYAVGDVSAILSPGDIVICNDLDDLIHTAKGLMDAGYDMILNSKKLTIEIMEV